VSFRHDFHECALAPQGAWLDHSWDLEGDVFKTAEGKIFLICAGDGRSASATLKLPPSDALAALTLSFVRAAAWPRRWITATVTNEVERDIALAWVLQSYELVSSKHSAPRHLRG
jgi:predicted DNA-binding protein (MmcQ/YjbR family)